VYLCRLKRLPGGRIKATLERRGTRIEDFDAAIAAHALALDATLVTANVDHMIRVPGLIVEDWS
jgi:tRNA(fMet)-specific endonuclease VapC